MAVGSNLSLKDKKLNIEAKESFRSFGNGLFGATDTDPTSEPEKLNPPQGEREKARFRSQSVRDWDYVRTYGDKVKRAAALIYAHFKNELLMPKGR